MAVDHAVGIDLAAAAGLQLDTTMRAEVSSIINTAVTGPSTLRTTLDGLYAYVAANPQTGTSYTLALTDVGKVVEINNAAANTLIVPPNTTAFPVGAVIEVCQLGTGQTTLTPGSGVTLRAPGGRLKLTAQYSTASLRKRAINEWVIAGDTST